MRWKRIGLIALTAFVLSVGITLLIMQREAKQHLVERYAVSPQRHLIVADGLQSLDGQSFKKTNLKGKWTLLLFGFSHCPEVCPTNMAFIAKEWSAIHQSKDEPAQVVFVGVDTDGDSPESMTEFLKPYAVPSIGVIGKPDAVSRLADQFGAYVSLMKDDKGKIQVGHAPHIFVINPEGEWAGLMSAPFANNDLAQFLNALPTHSQKLL